MKDFSTYVENLLYNNQCVIIPELGAFISNRESATINRDKTISPPRKVISFNSRLTTNDGLLINYISEKEKITYEEAQSIVRKSVEEYKQALKDGKSVNFINIGSLTQEGEGRLGFLPSNNVNLLTDSFGMTTIIPQEANLTQEEKQIPIRMEKEKMDNQKANTVILSQKKDNLLKYMKYAAIIVLGITAFSYGALIYLNNSDNNGEIYIVDSKEIQKELESRISEATFFSEAPLEIPSLTLNAIKIVEPKKEEIKKEIKEKKSEVKHTKVDLNYHVIAGAFSSKTNAETKVKQLREKGYKSNIVGRSRSGLFQVCYQSFQTQAEAEAFNKKIKQNKELDGWVLTTK